MGKKFKGKKCDNIKRDVLKGRQYFAHRSGINNESNDL